MTRFHISMASYANISAVNLEGVGHAAHIYLDSLLIEHGEGGSEGLTVYTPWPGMVTWIVTHLGRYFYGEFDVVGGDDAVTPGRPSTSCTTIIAQRIPAAC